MAPRRTHCTTGHRIHKRGKAMLLHKYLLDEWASALDPLEQQLELCGI